MKPALYCLWLICFAALALSLLAAPSPAKKPLKTGPLGVMLTIETQGKSDTRLVRLPAIYVHEGQRASAMTEPGPFKATMRTDLHMKLRDELSFNFGGSGTAKLIINDAVVLEKSGDLAGPPTEPVKLNKGKNKVVIEYQSPAKGDAAFRLYWSSSEFPPEPVPPNVLSYDPADEATKAGEALREGRLLIADLKCAACHADEGLKQSATAHASLLETFSLEKAKTMPMPELAKDAPALAGVGSRLSQAWMAHWISNPAALRPDATMPRVFHQAKEGIEPDAVHIAAYLSTLKDAAPGAEPPSDAALIAAGGRLFAHRKCNACHLLPDADGAGDTHARVPLAHVKSKYSPAALRAFLKNPQEHYAWIRMPNFHFSDVEADRLAAFLVSRPGKTLETPELKGDPARGKELVATTGCLNCHSIDAKTDATQLKAPALAALKPEQGCLVAEVTAQRKAPSYSVTPAQRAAIAAALARRQSLAHDTPAEFSQRQVKRLNCKACHIRDGQEDVFSSTDAEVAALIADGIEDEPQGSEDEKISPDQSIPMLTWTGEKLRPEWSAQFIAGKLQATRYRPWLRARMPSFPTYGPLLAHGLPLEHGFATVSAEQPAPKPQLADIGRKLAGKEGGFACNTCHRIADVPPNGVFEAPGLNFRNVRDRLTHHYYTRWVYAPIRMHPETKMMSFADGTGKTSLVEVFDGDARKQYEAIWNYLMEGQQIRPPGN